MDKLRITATSYLNTIPFVYGIEKSGYLKDYELLLDVPSACAGNLIDKKADIGLVPVALIPMIDKSYEILYDYCLGANGKVNTVLLLSRVPLGHIKEIYLDFESGTSVRLVKVLAKYFWKLADVKWFDIKNKDTNGYELYDSIVAIGDKTFELAAKYEYKYDLAEEWYKFTSLPFVFACWMKSNEVPQETIINLNKALSFGIKHKIEAVREFKKKNNIKVDLEEYVEKYMSYEFDDAKQKAFKMFMNYLK